MQPGMAQPGMMPAGYQMVSHFNSPKRGPFQFSVFSLFSNFLIFSTSGLTSLFYPIEALLGVFGFVQLSSMAPQFALLGVFGFVQLSSMAPQKFAVKQH